MNDDGLPSVTIESNGWIAKVKVVIMLINQVGIPSLIILFFFTFVGLTWSGKLPSPFVGKQDTDSIKSLVDQHMRETAETHKSIMIQGAENVAVLQEMKQSIKTMNCNMQLPDSIRLKCFEKMNKIPE